MNSLRRESCELTNETINLVALRRLLNAIGGDCEDLTELVEEYAVGAPSLVAKMRDGADLSDWVGVFQAAHTLKSNARDMGAIRLSELCEALEKEARAGPVFWVKERVAEIAAEEETARQALLQMRFTDIPDD